jgi:hypothetical protein
MNCGPILVVCSSSVTRALLVSLVGSFCGDVQAVESVARALSEARRRPAIVVIEAAIVRAGADAIERIYRAWSDVGIVLADRAYADARRGAQDAHAFGAAAFVPVPTDADTLFDAVRRAIGEARAPLSAPPSDPRARADSVPPSDDELRARYIERLWSRLDTLDPYQLLRVPANAPQAAILAAFRARALEFHPDRNSQLDEEARERVYQIFKRVSWAFRRIGEANARREWDASRATRG